MSIIKLSNVSKFYRNKNTISSGFNKINLELEMGEFIVITGESGSGKSTLLNVISGLDSYEEGEMYINGEETSHYTEVDYENYRRKYIGNIFQHFNLVNSYTVYQNIELVLLLNGYKKREAKEKVLNIIKTVGLTKYKNTKASKLSGGQKQRVAIARALAKDTPIIVADEPTGNLDVQSAKSIMKLLHEISKEKLVVIVTHNYEQVEQYATRKIAMHDGKIIEDKRLKKHECIEAETVKYKDLTFFNKLLIGFRNAFNIKTKFVLLLLVYLFLTLAVFSEYSSFRKMNYDNEAYGYNYYFEDLSENRVIINKKDRSAFTSEEIDDISKLTNVQKLVVDDLFLDMTMSVYNDNVYLYGRVYNIEEITSVDEGVMPSAKNEIVVAGNKDDYYFYMYGSDILNSDMRIGTSNGFSSEDTIKIVGIKYIDDLSYDQKIYLTSDLLNDLRKGLNVQYSTTEITINNNIFDSNYNRIYYNIVPNSHVKDGEVYTFQELEYYCKNYSCQNSNLNIRVKNLYYEDAINLKVKNVITKDNIRSLTGYKNYDEYMNTIFISENDYNRLYMKDTYQMSIYLEDTKIAAETISSLNRKGYDTFYMRDNIVNEYGEIAGIIKIIRGIIFIIAGVALFFISYFIIKIILKSRNIYFSTIRILGATKKVSRQLLNIELLIDINIAYLIFLGLIIFVKMGIISNAYLTDLTTYFGLIDYIAIYLILTIMSLLISNRYAHKLFKDSVMSTYREEV